MSCGKSTHELIKACISACCTFAQLGLIGLSGNTSQVRFVSDECPLQTLQELQPSMPHALHPRDPRFAFIAILPEMRRLDGSAAISSLFSHCNHLCGATRLNSHSLNIFMRSQCITHSSKHLQHADVRAGQALRCKLVADDLIGCCLPCTASCVRKHTPHHQIYAL